MLSQSVPPVPPLPAIGPPSLCGSGGLSSPAPPPAIGSSLPPPLLPAVLAPPAPADREDALPPVPPRAPPASPVTPFGCPDAEILKRSRSVVHAASSTQESIAIERSATVRTSRATRRH